MKTKEKIKRCWDKHKNGLGWYVMGLVVGGVAVGGSAYLYLKG